MTPTERERIVEEAEGISRLRVWPEHVRVNFKNGYIAGATFEHDKVRNQAIDEVVKMLTEYVDGEYFEMYWVSLKEKLESLKTII